MKGPLFLVEKRAQRRRKSCKRCQKSRYSGDEQHRDRGRRQGADKLKHGLGVHQDECDPWRKSQRRNCNDDIPNCAKWRQPTHAIHLLTSGPTRRQQQR
jgi:hypothetical protein